MENENKISSMAGSAHCTEEIMSACALCPRECLADRSAGKKGFCGMDERIYLARAALHMWEEPCISGTKGSGTVFFSGCGLRCCFCQNHDIAMGSRGRAVSVERLGEIFLELKEKRSCKHQSGNRGTLCTTDHRGTGYGPEEGSGYSGGV